jgi:hypothetical protein
MECVPLLWAARDSLAKLLDMEISATQAKVLSRYPRAIYHLRAQLARKKLMPVFGAGASQPIGLPNWQDLITRIATDARVGAVSLAASTTSQASRVQLIFHHFRRKQLQAQVAAGQIADEHSGSISLERRIAHEWREILHASLYKTAKDVETHPYLAEFVPVIRQAPLTVNYNFDDSLQILLARLPRQDEDETKGFETVWEPTVQYRSSSSVIYHPNGFMPRELHHNPSPNVVLLDDTFADQLIDAQRGHYSTLLSHFFRFTSLLVGLSLADPTLKHLLRQSAQANPGHVHYYVAYRNEGVSNQVEQDDATTYSNFDTYNLVTLFLNAEEIAALATLLSLPNDEFALAVNEQQLPSTYTFYLSGAVGVGKTTALTRFKSLTSFDEWLDPKDPLLHTAADKLTEGEKQTVDLWINKQFRRRNFLIGRTDTQLSVIDRSPIDPIAFAASSGLADAKKRALELLDLYGSPPVKGACTGKIIFMKGSPEVMNARVYDRHKEGSPEYIAKLQEKFERLWSRAASGVRTLQTMDLALADVVKTVSRIIHLEDYSVVDFNEILHSIKNSETEF